MFVELADYVFGSRIEGELPPLLLNELPGTVLYPVSESGGVSAKEIEFFLSLLLDLLSRFPLPLLDQIVKLVIIPTWLLPTSSFLLWLPRFIAVH